MGEYSLAVVVVLLRRQTQLLLAALLVLGGASCGGDEPITIMPIGDSITQGAAGTASYRCHLHKLLDDAGVSFDFVGSQSEPYGGPEHDCPHDFDQDHEGYAGGRIEGIGLSAMPAAEESKPDVALLHVGTNDIYEWRDPADAASELESLILELQAVQPNITILVAQIIPCGMSSPHPALCFREEVGPVFHEAIASLSGFSTEESSVFVVDMNTGFSRENLRDDWHPNDAGEQLMASRWMNAIEEAGLF